MSAANAHDNTVPSASDVLTEARGAQVSGNASEIEVHNETAATSTSMERVKRFCAEQLEYLLSSVNLRADTYLRNTLRENGGVLPASIAVELPAIHPCLEAFADSSEEVKQRVVVDGIRGYSNRLAIETRFRSGNGEDEPYYVVSPPIPDMMHTDSELLSDIGDRYSTVYVGNIPPRTTQKIIVELFSFVGPVLSVRSPYLNNPANREQKRNVFAFVEFANRSSVRYACRVMNGIQLYGTALVVRAAHCPKREDTDVELFVDNLAECVDEGILEEVFSVCGKPIDVLIARFPNGSSKGYAFVSYQTWPECESAIASLSSLFLLGRMITVDFSHRTKRRSDEVNLSAAGTAVASSLIHSSVVQQSVTHLRKNVNIANIVDSRYRFEIANLIATEHAWRVGIPHPPMTPSYYTAVRVLTEVNPQ
eukprot:gb/GECG01013673.1/.p1 GENE.gb/GECG01013673.1/~~gb/GECG01013673.1/.p1  ORF type:complete len:422 (+),score=43.44 gb/GECG01013673.1/:1-1266(+)